MKTNIVAEIGINHNGSLDLCKELINIASDSGCDFVKIQKRTPKNCIPEKQKNKIKETPWGKITYLKYKEKIEFNSKQIEKIAKYSCQKNIIFFSSVWDKSSVEIMRNYTSIGKIPSACITDIELCKFARKKFNKLIISVGMSTEKEIEDCINACEPDVVMHTNSIYPCPTRDLNLNYISWLKRKWPNKEIGYSGHEVGIVETFAAVALGSSWIERHITINKKMWGSDQSNSLEKEELRKLVLGIRDIEKAISKPCGPRTLSSKEIYKKKTLRKQQ